MSRPNLNLCAATLAFCATAAFAQDIIQPGQTPRNGESARPTAAANGYIVRFARGTPKAARATAAFQAGAQLRYNYDSFEAIAVTVPNENALNALRRHAAVVQVAPDWGFRANAKPGTGGGGKPLPLDTRQVISYEVQRVGIPAGGSDGTGIGIAVVDSGIDYAHPDLNPAADTAATAYNAISPGASCQDDGGHGTHLSGLIAAQNNSIGILGVAPAARLYCVKVLNSALQAYDSWILAGLDWVIQKHDKVNPNIRVVNISLGRPLGTDETLENSAMRPLVQALYNAGVVIVAASGNDPTLEIGQIVPAGFPEVLAVASTIAHSGIRTCYLFGTDAPAVPADTASSFTTDGAGVTVSAPGEERTDIVSLGSAGCVGLMYGTLSTTLGTGGTTRKLVPSLAEARGSSFSAALVSGVVARVIQKQLVPATGNGAEVEGIRSWIKNNASRKDVAPLDHPWMGIIYVPTTFDGVREGIAQAPQ